MRRPCCAARVAVSSEIVEVIIVIVKLGTVTASDMKMHHVLTILTLTFIQGHTALTHETNKCLIISETSQAIPNKQYSFKVASASQT